VAGRVAIVMGALLVAGPAAADAQEPRVVAPGTVAGGVEVGGMTVEDATAKLDAELGPRTRRRVTVKVAGRAFSLSSQRARVRFDAARTAERAFYRGRAGEDHVPLAIEHSGKAVAGFVANVAARVGRPARNASVRITVTRIIRRRARNGLGVNQARLAKRLSFVLDHPTATRTLRARRRGVRPAVSGRDLLRRYATIVTVHRRGYRLRLFKGLRRAASFGIAVGRAGLETPTGLFRITSKQVNPPWHVPNRPWAGGLAGQTIPGGAPGNPLRARWLGIVDGVGIHGTSEEWSIGSRASHGCIRMRVRDVVRLYRRVPMGTPVLIR